DCGSTVERTPYGDTEHVCKVCENCGEIYGARQTGAHIAAFKNGFNVYSCQKNDKIYKKPNCILCEVIEQSQERDDFGVRVLKSFLCENENCVGFTELRPNAEG